MRALGLLLIVSLAGCVSGSSLPDPLIDGVSPEPTPASDFEPLPVGSKEATSPQPSSIDREVVASAAADLVTEYLSITDEVTRAGGEGSNAIASVVTQTWATTEDRGFGEYRSRDIRTIGVSGFDHLQIQSIHRVPDGRWEVAVFVCVDAQSVWVIPADAPEPPDDLVAWLASGQPEEEPTEEQASQWQEYIAITKPDAGQIEPVVMWLVGPTPTDLRIDAIETWRGYHPCGPIDSPQQ